MGLTDLALEDDDDDDDDYDEGTEVQPRVNGTKGRTANALGLGSMSAGQARDRTSLPVALAPRERSLSTSSSIQRKRSSAEPSLTRHQLVDNGPVSLSMKRGGSQSSRKSSTKGGRNSAPQLPAIAGIGSLGSIVRDSHEVEPDYDEDDDYPEEPVDRRSRSGSFVPRPTSRIMEEDEDEDFVEADDSAFPVTPGLSERGAFVIPDDEKQVAEAPDVVDEDSVAVVLDKKNSVATVGAHLPTDHSQIFDEDEEIPAYDEATAQKAFPEKSSSKHTKTGLAAAAGAGGGLAAGAGLHGLRPSKGDKYDRSPVIPGGFGEAQTYDDDLDYQPQGTMYGSDDEPEVKQARAVPVVAASQPAKKIKRKQPKRQDSMKDAPELVAAPPLTRTMSPPAPQKPQKSKARQLSSNKLKKTTVADERDDDGAYAERKKKISKGGALAGGAIAVGGASYAAAKHLDSEDEPAILSDDDDDSLASEELEYAQRPRKGTAKRRSTFAAASKPTKRSTPVKSLTPVQRHYLLKSLVCLQMQLEWEELEKLGALTQFGYPFATDRPKLTRVKTELSNEYTTGDDVEDEADDPYADDTDAARRLENLQEPLILRHLFQVHLRVFPGLDQAPLKFWQKRIQIFFDEMAARNFSTSVERSEYSKRRFYSLVLTRYLGGYFARGVGVRGQGELRGPGPGEKGSERWGIGKQWGKGTVKRGLDRPARIDAVLWKKIDALFGEGEEGQVWRRAGKETTRVRGDWQSWKEQIIENETGLEETINFLDISKINNLPLKYRNAEEWARNHAAYLLHSLFVTAPGADSTYSVLKGIHTLFPYWGAKQLLKYANAQVLIEGILNLLLARPAGAKSLIQRIATYVIGSEAASLQKDYINPLRKAINDSDLTTRIDEYIARGNRPEGRSVRAKAQKTGDDVLTVILLSAGGSPLRREVQDSVVEMQHAFARSPFRGLPDMAYPGDSAFAKENPDKVHVPEWDASRSEAEEALKFARLKLYLRDSLKKRDREQATKVASGALVPTIIKDFLQTVMYDVIKQIASTADLSARLGDLQVFIDDLIEVKKKKDDSIQAWIALAARHENSLYFLVHECASISGRFWEWCQIGLDYMALSTTDPVHPADRSAKNIEVNLEELLQDSRMTDKDVELILEEVDELAVYTKWSKVAYELEMRKNFLLSRSEAATTSKLTEDDVPSQRMKEDIQDIDGLMRELMESEGVPVDDGTLPNESRGTEARELATFWFDVMDPLGQHLKAERGASELTYTPQGITPPAPCLKYVRKALPAFREALKERLPDWQHGDAKGPKQPKQPGTRKPVTSSYDGASINSKSKKGKGLFGR